MRLLPQRRYTVLILSLGGALITFMILRGVHAPLDVSTLLWLALGALGGALLAALIVLISASGDTRLLQLRETFPNAIVEQTYPDEKLAEAFAALDPWMNRDLPSFFMTTTMVLDVAGVSFWTGSRTPSLVAEVPWSDVADFSIAPSVDSRVTGRPALDRLLLRSSLDGYQTQLMFGLERTDRFKPGAQFLPQDELAAIVAKAALWRRAPASNVAHPSIDRVAGMTSAGIVPGVTAWAAHRSARLNTFPFPVIFLLAAVVGGLVTRLTDGPAGVPLVVVGLFAPLVGFIAERIDRSARRRERAAGYTTLNGRELDLQQRHPLTGTILREAGQPPLDPQRFRQLIGR